MGKRTKSLMSNLPFALVCFITAKRPELEMKRV